MENIFEINMEDTNNFLLLNSLALNCLNREEYADFLTVMQKIRDRSLPVLEQLKEKTPVDGIRYPHDIEINLQYKVFKNNQLGERVELSKYSEIPLLVKVPLDQDPNILIKDICNHIVGITK